MNEEEWITTKEAAGALNINVRTVLTRIHEGKLEAKREGKSWKVHSSLSPHSEEAPAQNTVDNSAALEILTDQLRQKDQQIENLQKQLESASQAAERSDTLHLQTIRLLEQNQRSLEVHRTPWYRRIRKGKQSEEDA